MATRCCRSLSIWVKQVGLLQGWGGKVFHKIRNVCTWNLAPPTPQAAALDVENILGSCGLCMRGAGTEARERYPRCMCRWGQGPWAWHPGALDSRSFWKEANIAPSSEPLLSSPSR